MPRAALAGIVARALALVLTLAAPSAASAGVRIEGKSDGKESQRILLEGNRMRVDGSADGKPEIVVFDGDARRMIRIDPAQKSWSEVTEQDLEAMKGELGKMLAELPPEQRRQLEAAMGKDRAAPAGSWAKTGRAEQALGKKCDVHRLAEGEDVQEICVAPWGAFGLAKSDFAALGAFEEFFSKLGVPGARKGAVAWGDLPGVPLVTWDVEGDRRTESFRATKVEKAKVAASEFQPPAGFTKDETPGVAR